MVSFHFSLLAVLLGQAASQKDSGAFTSPRENVIGTLALRDLISSAVDRSARGTMGRKSYPLPAPRRDYGITANDIKAYLQHSMLAICTPKEVETNTCFCKGKFEEARVFRNDTLDSQAVVAVDPQNRLIVVSYRLTVSKKNFDTDYDTVLVNFPGATNGEKVHRGNLEFFKSIHPAMEPAVLSLLKDPEYMGYKIHVTGYSLGGAVAAISLPAWTKVLQKNKLENKIQVYTYAGTRPGNMDFARYLEAFDVPIVRYAKRGDGVPLIPDQNLGYSQVGLEFYDDHLPFNNKPLKKCDGGVLEDNSCALSGNRFLALHHLTPFHKKIPLPPLC